MERRHGGLIDIGTPDLSFWDSQAAAIADHCQRSRPAQYITLIRVEISTLSSAQLLYAMPYNIHNLKSDVHHSLHPARRPATSHKMPQ